MKRVRFVLSRDEGERLGRLVMDAAREELLPRFNRVVGRHKADGSLITEADLAVQERLLSELDHRWPDIPLLGEEMDPAHQRRILAESERFWCLDPLDGTANYAAGMPFFGVSLALVERGEVTLGVVCDPMRDECFRAQKGAGAWLNTAPLRLEGGPGSLADCIAIVDLKRLAPGLACRLATRPPFRSQRSLGSVALDWCWLAAGRCQLYLHGGQRAWDYAAGSLVFAEAGGTLCLSPGIEGPCQTRIGLDPRTGTAAASPALFEAWRAWLLGYAD